MSARRRQVLAAAAVILSLATLVHASPAWALCPNCLGQNHALSTTMRIVGVFLLVPPAIFFFVARLVRRLSEDR